MLRSSISPPRFLTWILSKPPQKSHGVLLVRIDDIGKLFVLPQRPQNTAITSPRNDWRQRPWNSDSGHRTVAALLS